MYIRDKYKQIKQVIQCNICPSLKLRPTDPPFELHFSKKQKYVSCLISKNGCSSILSSILKYDFNESLELREDEKIWKEYDIWEPHEKEFRVFFTNSNDISTSVYKDYRKFIVLRNPLDRFISFVNNTYKESEYDFLFDKSLPKERYVDSVIKMYPHMIDYTRSDKRYDKHAIPQRVYYEEYSRLFGNELEIVLIEDLPEYFHNLTGQPLVKSNITAVTQKVCTKDSLTQKQNDKILWLLKKYEFCQEDFYTSLFIKQLKID